MAVQLTQEMILAAQANQQKYGVPASITLGQIMLESGGSYEGGVSKLAYNAKNLFGIKGTGSAGVYHINTNEQGKNGTYTTTAAFRKYHSYSESIEDHGRLLSSDRYTAKTQNATTVEEYARALQAAGYATDKNYANKLLSVISSNNLTQYDNGEIGGVIPTTSPDYYETEEGKLDILGQVVKFVLIVGLLVLAVLFILKGTGIEGRFF